MIECFKEPGLAQRWCEAARRAGRTVGFVPTMGALHEGHLSLIRRARSENDQVVTSVFVNPLQFNDPADLEQYPGDFEEDSRILASARCSMVFTGTLEQFFPGALDGEGRLPAGRLKDPGPCALGLEGRHRPGHFAGVATIVERLFELVAPERAYFGAKDFQQSLVVQDLARARRGPRVVTCPTVREPSGLALSSRNALLDDDSRGRAVALSRALVEVRRVWQDGLRDPSRLEEVMRCELDRDGLDPEYAAVRDPQHWTEETPSTLTDLCVGLIAAQVSGVRLIDSMLLHAVPASESGADT